MALTPVPHTRRPRQGSLTLDPQALLVLDDEKLLGLLQLLQLILGVLRDQSQLLKRLVDLEVFLGHGVHQGPSRRGTLETCQRGGSSELGSEGGRNLRPGGPQYDRPQTPNLE